MPGNNEEKRQKAIVIQRTDVDIDRALAVAIQRAWGTMLLKTRYPERAYLGLDGYTAEFSVLVGNAGMLHGEIWSPHQGLPKEFVELGHALADFCATPPDQRAPKQTKLLKQLATFTRKAE